MDVLGQSGGVNRINFCYLPQIKISGTKHKGKTNRQVAQVYQFHAIPLKNQQTRIPPGIMWPQQNTPDHRKTNMGGT